MKIKHKNLLIPFVYGGLYLFTSFLKGNLNYYNLFIFALGAAFGVVLMRLDESHLHQYYLEPHAKKINLMTRSLLFMISLLPLGLFVITSTGSKLGTGLFLGVITVLLSELIFYRQSISDFHSRFMFQLKRKLSVKEVDYFVAGFGGLTLVLVLLTFFLGR